MNKISIYRLDCTITQNYSPKLVITEVPVIVTNSLFKLDTRDDKNKDRFGDFRYHYKQVHIDKMDKISQNILEDGIILRTWSQEKDLEKNKGLLVLRMTELVENKMKKATNLFNKLMEGVSYEIKEPVFNSSSPNNY